MSFTTKKIKKSARTGGRSRRMLRTKENKVTICYLLPCFKKTYSGYYHNFYELNLA
jgi:hypothetical protein